MFRLENTKVLQSEIDEEEPPMVVGPVTNGKIEMSYWYKLI